MKCLRFALTLLAMAVMRLCFLSALPMLSFMECRRTSTPGLAGLWTATAGGLSNVLRRVRRSTAGVADPFTSCNHQHRSCNTVFKLNTCKNIHGITYKFTKLMTEINPCQGTTEALCDNVFAANIFINKNVLCVLLNK